jgi:ATP-dependent DNA helicase RecG
VCFSRLGLVVVDEQHRFGVYQRYQLMEKGEYPDTLVMTATPIPRSLALTVYGDLDISIIDQLPPGRKPIKTVLKNEESRQEVYSVLRREVRRGRQVFIVYPLVEKSEKLDIRAAAVMAEKLQKKVFPEFKVGLIHGRLKSELKEQTMRDFVSGRIQILVATTVIEVGIDVPNATVMMVENAERFGLSQLHQLRGRIGRGTYPGLCILMVQGVKSQEAYQRLDIMRKSADGFQIAEKDLEIRGPGEFLGTRQSGLPAFRFANIVRDRKWLEVARLEAEKYLAASLQESDKGRRKTIALDHLLRRWREKYRFFEVG